MKILFVIIPEKGHIHPYLGPAAHLRQRGHAVAFYAVHDVIAADPMVYQAPIIASRQGGPARLRHSPWQQRYRRNRARGALGVGAEA